MSESAHASMWCRNDHYKLQKRVFIVRTIYAIVTPTCVRYSHRAWRHGCVYTRDYILCIRLARTVYQVYTLSMTIYLVIPLPKNTVHRYIVSKYIYGSGQPYSCVWLNV